MKKFNVPIKNINEDYITTDNVWLTINDKKNSFQFIRKENKKEMILIINNGEHRNSTKYSSISEACIPANDKFLQENLNDLFQYLTDKNQSLNAYYINSRNNSIQIINRSVIFSVLFKRKERKIVYLNENISATIDNGDALVGFSSSIPKPLVEKLSHLIFNSNEISYPSLKIIQSAINHLKVNSVPIFLIDVSSHQSYAFPIKSTLKTVGLTIDMIRDKVLKHHTDKIWQIETVLHEALVNAITYGNEMDFDKFVTVSYEIGEKGLRVIIKDSGNGFDLKNISVPVGNEALDRISGRGIYIMKKFSDAMYYNEKGNEVMLFFNF